MTAPPERAGRAPATRPVSARPTAAAWLWLCACLCGALLGGCSSLPFGSKGDAADAPAAAASAASAVAAERADYRIEIVVEPAALRTLLQNYLDLARFQNAPQTEGITRSELDRLVGTTPAQVSTLLETEGYFNAQTVVERDETTVARGNGSATLPLLRVRVTPGPRARVSALTIESTGPLQAAVQAGDRKARALMAALRKGWTLQPGQPFRQPAWSSAKNEALARLAAEGYPAASWNASSAQVDADDNTVRLTLVADSGPLFRLGALRIEGLQRYDESSVRRLVNFKPGAPYSEQLLQDYQERLRKVGLFEGVVVDIDPDPANAAAAPVRVRVKELTLQQATVGAGISANTGPRLTLEHVHRKVFGSRWIATNKFEFGPDLTSWQGGLISHPLEGLYRNLVSGGAQRLRTNDEVLSSWNARVGRTKDTGRIERLYFAEFTHARLQTPSRVDDNDAVSVNYHWTLRDVDNVLLPTRGRTLTAQGGLGYARGQQRLVGESQPTVGAGPFVRTYGRYTWYKPLGNSWYATARAEAGQVFVRDTVGVPETLLFRAGGDESVRGYAYRELGPTVNGTLASGRVLATGSVEVARPISARLPAFWWAVFVDAGNAADRWQDLSPALGYGVGLRWRSPVGPLRLDLAYGQEVERFRLHLSVGIAF